MNNGCICCNPCAAINPILGNPGWKMAVGSVFLGCQEPVRLPYSLNTPAWQIPAPGSETFFVDDK